MLADLMEFLVNLGKKLQSIFYWFTDKIHDVLVGLWNFIVDALCYLVEQFVRAIDFKSELFDASGTLAGLPPQLIYLMNECGVDNMILILTSALFIRFMLNLIPGALTRV